MQAAAQPVGKAALAKILGWTRPKLDRRLTSDAAFPVVQRGDQSGGWQFDVAAVQGHLGLAAPKPPKGTKPKNTPAATPIDQAQLRDAVAAPPPSGARTVHLPQKPPRKSAHHEGEATARQRKDAADAALRENKLKIENGQLVDRAELRQDLAKMLASVGNDLDGLPEEVCRVLECPDRVPLVQGLIDKIRIRMVQNADPLLQEPPADD